MTPTSKPESPALNPATVERELNWTEFRRKQIGELRPYVEGESLSGVSVSDEDRKAGSPKAGDMIARNPKNHADQWLVAAKYFADNFEPATPAPSPAGVPDGWMPIESAPKDGEEVLAGRGKTRSVASYRHWRTGDTPLRDDTQRWRCPNGFHITPTHWRPLPAPPSEVKP